MMHTTHDDNPITKERRDLFLKRQSIIEMRKAASRAPGDSRSGQLPRVARPVRSDGNRPWLPLGRNCSCRSDDGVIVAARATRWPACRDRMAIEGAFQGGGMGEVSASKIAGGPRAGVRRLREWQADLASALLLETGGVRLQEANLGEAVVAEIHAEKSLRLRRKVPVIGVITGMVGCFGGMSITAGLCSYLVILPAAAARIERPRGNRAGVLASTSSTPATSTSDLEPDGGRAALRNRLRGRTD